MINIASCSEPPGRSALPEVRCKITTQTPTRTTNDQGLYPGDR
jgi:hypothetical protein